ncbi:MAG: PAS domain-containing protein [Anaerolineae bacterium]|jgi:PAS domain-containing protein
MNDATLLAAILDIIDEPILVADTDHVIRYMNKAAIAFYDGGSTLLGSSLLDCHNEESQHTILEILDAMEDGEDQRLFSDDGEQRVTMQAVRDPNGRLLGYTERYEPPPAIP